MNIIFIGAPGSGKGTQASRIAQEKGMKQFSTGDAFRAAVNSGSELGKRIKAIMDAGELVADDLVNAVVKDAIKEYEAQGIIFDGYPRTLEQARFLQGITRIDAIVNIKVRDDEVVERVSSRLVCPTCKRGYNTIWLPPRNKGKCDDDGSALVQREEDRPETVRKRLVDFHTKTEPIIKLYEGVGVRVIDINGEQAIDKVFEDIKKALGKMKKRA